MAKRLEGTPFHLVATHCQRGERKTVVDYIRGKGLAAETPNVTVSSFGGHPKVKGNGHVPYYMVFDHHGDLVHHHMCGDYHGGDGLKMIELVDKLLVKVPVIYLGKAPFAAVPALAKQVKKRKRLPAAIQKIETLLATEASAAKPARTALTPAARAELGRLKTAIADYRHRQLNQAESLLATEPTALIPALQDLHKHFKGTAGGAEIEAKLTAARGSAELKESITVFKSYRKTLRRLARKTPPSKKTLSHARKQLSKLIAANESLPITARLRETLAGLK